MTNLWKRLRNRLFAPPAPPDAEPVTAARPAARPAAPADPPWLPLTSRSAAPADGGRRPRLFDPALKHFASAFRPGDPAFEAPGAGRRWAELRCRITDHVLRASAESEWGDRLILRGSRPLKAWLGDAAREPGDLDWVVDPPAVGPDDAWGAGLCDGLVAAVFARPAPAGIELDRSGVAIDDIWTYERARGRRVVFPWRAAGLPGGAVQVDVVFHEALTEPDRRTPIPAADGGCISLRAAGRAQSLAWKLLWLATDSYPQGKDLYDAVLLAEHVVVPRAVLEQTFRRAVAGPMPLTASALVRAGTVDWDNFRSEYPWVGGGASDWLTRLARALEPTFAESGAAERSGDGVTGPPPAPDPAWLTTTVVLLARGIAAEDAYDRLPILADALQDAGCDDADLLDHCRAGGPHARGCWVVDLLLEKS